MALMTPDTFDPLRRYVGVRLQQGVVIVDADENEREDIRQFELRAFLKWFVGDGVPEGNDGFHVVGTGAANDFTIQAGAPAPPPGTSNVERGLRHVGRCLVDGLDVLIDSDITFVSQPLHNSHANAATLAAALGTTVITPPPNITGPATVYLDVWQRLVTSNEDATLIHPGLGTESCVRFKREWVVRVRAGTTVPSQGSIDYASGHSYYALATIARRTGDPLVNIGDVVDVRERRLLTPPAHLIEDTLGTAPTGYRQGLGRPVVSLRSAINALLRGTIPMTAEQPIAAHPGNDQIARATLNDASGGIVTFWTSDRAGGTHVFGARLDPNAASPVFGPATQLTTGVQRRSPHATLLDTGQLLLVYESQTGATNEDIHLRRGPTYTSLAIAAEQPVANDAAIRQRAPFVVNIGTQAIVFWHEETGLAWQFNRYDVGSNSFPNPKTALGGAAASVPTTPFELHAVRGPANSVFVAYRTQAQDIQTVQIPFGGAPANLFTHDSTNPDTAPFLVFDSTNTLCLFWAIQAAPGGICYRRLVNPATNTWDAISLVPETNQFITSAPYALLDPFGTLWLFYSRRVNAPGTTQDIWHTTLDPNTSNWGPHYRLTSAPENDSNSLALNGPAGTIYLLWMRLIGVNGELFTRRLYNNI
ncbi:MAG TPA: DUF6519 domain-containing protein [Pyrinomonadaceae bacterium]|jgi:hypothetical protein